LNCMRERMAIQGAKLQPLFLDNTLMRNRLRIWKLDKHYEE
jgi:hypothetical protein